MTTNPFEPPKEVNEQATRSDLRGLLSLVGVAALAAVVCSGSAAGLLGLRFGLFVAITAAVVLGAFGVSLLIGRLLLQTPRT
jgi:hypothetical protein